MKVNLPKLTANSLFCASWFRRQRKVFWISASLCWLVLSAPVSAAIVGEFTNISSSSEQIISLRHQEHFWESDDGAQHLLINAGTDNQSSSLTLLTRLADNDTWVESFTLPNTGANANADSLLRDQQLHMVYGDTDGAINYAVATYDANTQAWSTPDTSVVYSDPDAVLLSWAPTLTFDSDNTAYVGFYVRNIETQKSWLQMSFSQTPLGDWQDSTQTWGTVNKFTGKSARVTTVNGRVGLLYTNQFRGGWQRVATMNWSQPDLGESVTGQWVSEELHREQTSIFKKDADPYGSHFNVVGSDDGDLHLIWAFDERAHYLHYEGDTQVWGSISNLLDNQYKTTYVQISRHADGGLYPVFNVGSSLIVMESLDNGANFDVKALLRHSANEGEDWSHPRIETPSVFSGSLDILQQVSITNAAETYQLLYHFQYNPAP